jgi:hypothetical protein
MIVQSTVSKSVSTAIEQIVKREMRPFGFRAIKVASSEDHDGDPILLIDVEYSSRGKPIDPTVVAGLVSKLRDRLWELGEARFPHIRHHFSEQQKVGGYS